jgi:hypothetical protein
LLIIAVTSLIAYLAVFVLGILHGLGLVSTRHFLLAIPVTSLVVFGHAMTMFFLIGCGSRIKEVLAETGITGEYRAAVRGLHNRLFPPATLAILVTMGAFILGGGADTGAVPPLLHGGVALAGLLANGWAVYLEFETVIACVAIIDELGREIEAREATAAGVS